MTQIPPPKAFERQHYDCYPRGPAFPQPAKAIATLITMIAIMIRVVAPLVSVKVLD